MRVAPEPDALIRHAVELEGTTAVDHPDCTSELTELAKWYDSQGAKPFPYLHDH